MFSIDATKVRNRTAKVTKVFTFSPSQVQTGAVYVGRLVKNLRVGVELSMENDYLVTSLVSNIYQTPAGDFIVRTQTGIYFVQIIK